MPACNCRRKPCASSTRHPATRFHLHWKKSGFGWNRVKLPWMSSGSPVCLKFQHQTDPLAEPHNVDKLHLCRETLGRALGAPPVRGKGEYPPINPSYNNPDLHSGLYSADFRRKRKEG